MLRLVSLLAVAAALAVSLLVPGSASAVLGSCPSSSSGFLLVSVNEAAPDQDRNRDGFVCMKTITATPGQPPRLIFIDNNRPDPIAQGITDTGSVVFVDTATGDVLSG